jgi:Ca2+-binding RTX toxin-like protein
METVGSFQNTGPTGSDELTDAFEDFAGSNGADTIYGNALANTIIANNGSDHVYGAGGNDAINGSENSDFLYGQAGNDVLNGGNLPSGDNNDYCDGGAGTGDVNHFCETSLGVP